MLTTRSPQSHSFVSRAKHCFSSIARMGRSYQDAITALNTLQSNSEVIKSIRENGRALRNKDAIPEMIGWVRRTGYEPADFNRLRPIHIAGTKGKGSTSAFISSILAQYIASPSQPKPLLHKIGLYTSPHLRFVRERIQINNEPLSENAFARFFFETWDRLEASAKARGESTDRTAKPSYFRFLTLMAFHTYMSENVDTAVIECGIGGEYDSTNILVSPTVTGITSLGIDHTHILGNTIGEIAWHKGGIMKPSIPCFTVPQPPKALEVLHQRAAEISAPLTAVERDPALKDIKLGLAADFQKTNASLAIAIASSYLRSLPTAPPNPNSNPNSDLPPPPEFIRGLEQVHWPGRCETRNENDITWHIDSGHTLESIELAATWFASQLPPPSPSPELQPPRILLFNQQTRDANALARTLFTTLSAALGPHPFTHAVFCTNRTFEETGFRPDLLGLNVDAKALEGLDVQRGLEETWRGSDERVEAVVRGSIEEAVDWCREVVGRWQQGREGKGEKGHDTGGRVLGTGSVHLVGGLLEVLESASPGSVVGQKEGGAP